MRVKMKGPPMWKIMAGRGSAFVDQFIEESLVGIGWSEAGDYTNVRSREELFELFAKTWPEQTKRQLEVATSQVWRFMHEVGQGERLLTYDPDERVYHIGEVVGETIYNPTINERLPVQRAVRWVGAVNRDDLSTSTKNSLGAIMTLFKLSDQASAEIEAVLQGRTVASVAVTADTDAGDATSDPFANIDSIAFERVKDQILSLEWDDMQELVAALLRALDYRTIVAPKGSDRGRDITASRDGFGFERPRIVVEVKHRKGQMGAPDVRSFLSALHSEDRGLYVSTGGFSKEAYYQAENANNVIHLMTIDGLAEALLDQYEKLDDIGRRFLPLRRLYWPE